MGTRKNRDLSEFSTNSQTDCFEVSTSCTKSEFLSVVQRYARDVVQEYDLAVDINSINWEISTRAKRRAGAVKHQDGKPTSISITWEFFQQNGWKTTSSTVRHELIHVHLLNTENDPSHGPKFQKLADRLDTTVNCEVFTEPQWWVVCQDCESKIARYRTSKLVKRPDKFRCSCGGQFQVDKNQKP